MNNNSNSSLITNNNSNINSSNNNCNNYKSNPNQFNPPSNTQNSSNRRTTLEVSTTNSTNPVTPHIKFKKVNSDNNINCNFSDNENNNNTDNNIATNNTNNSVNNNNNNSGLNVIGMNSQQQMYNTFNQKSNLMSNNHQHLSMLRNPVRNNLTIHINSHLHDPQSEIMVPQGNVPSNNNLNDKEKDNTIFNIQNSKSETEFNQLTNNLHDHTPNFTDFYTQTEMKGDYIELNQNVLSINIKLKDCIKIINLRLNDDIPKVVINFINQNNLKKDLLKPISDKIHTAIKSIKNFFCQHISTNDKQYLNYLNNIHESILEDNIDKFDRRYLTDGCDREDLEEDNISDEKILKSV